jgi:hypothetical protein
VRKQYMSLQRQTNILKLNLMCSETQERILVYGDTDGFTWDQCTRTVQ